MRSETYIVRLVDAEGMPTKAERKVYGVPFFQDAADAAEFFTSELVDQDMREQRAGEEDIGHFAGGEPYVVDVRHPDSEDWHRFVVTVKARLEYKAEPARCEKCGWPLRSRSEFGCTPGNCSQRAKNMRM